MTGRDRPLRVCLFGLGFAGSKLHLPALRRLDGVAVVAACDPDEAARAAVAGVETYAGWQETMELPHDAIVVASPPESHFELASAGLASGKHVYVEKPMTTSGDDARALAKLARATRSVVQVGFAYRFHPLWRRVALLLEEHRLLRPLRLEATFTSAAGGRGWSAPVVDLASHHLDLVAWLTGASLTELEATRSGRLNASWDDGTELTGTYDVGPGTDRVELTDGRATVLVDRFAATRLRSHGLRLGRAGLPDPRLLRTRLGSSGWERSFEFALEGFVAAVRAGSAAAGSAGIEDGVRAVAAGEATLRSLETAGPVAVHADQ